MEKRYKFLMANIAQQLQLYINKNGKDPLYFIINQNTLNYMTSYIDTGDFINYAMGLKILVDDELADDFIKVVGD